ncbi:unnamed protein product [Effrenium voratum]|nr:unnamed protein product [Effrenium voratum]
MRLCLSAAVLLGCVSAEPDKEVLAHYGSFEAPSLTDTSFEQVQELLLQGRPFVVADGAKGLPMAAWDCEQVRKEFPHSRLRQEGGNSELNAILMNSNWMQDSKPYPGAELYPPGAPKIRPFYWDIAKAYREERERKWGKDPAKVVSKIVGTTAVPYWLPQQSVVEMGRSSEMWFHPPGAGARAHMDPHCRTTVSFCFSGKRKWRMMVPPAEPHPEGYFDGDIYKRSEWQPTFELEASNGSAVVVFPGMVHETLSVGEVCSASVSQTFAVPTPAAYWRAFWPRFALIGEDVGQCGDVVEQLVTLKTRAKVRPQPEPMARKAGKHFAYKMDADKDGKISKKEMLLPGESEDSLTELISFHDTNKDGIVTTKELVDSWVMFAVASHRSAQLMGGRTDNKEDVLGYDDTAFYYFVVSVLTCVAVPWTLGFIYSFAQLGHDADSEYPRRSASFGSKLRYCSTSAMVEKVEKYRREARRFTAKTGLIYLAQAVVLCVMWAMIFGTMTQLGYEKEIQKFDPFEILDVLPGASPSQIKRAYRKLSLSFHPDKNPDDPLAASRFIQITKAFQALTDEIAKRNWEKFGNPDGPQTTKVGIGLPRFLLEKENHLMILCSFFFVIVILVPMTFICYYQNSRNFAVNGVMVETLQFLGFYIGESNRAKHGPELLAACAESRSMGTRPWDNTHIKKLGGHVIEHKKRVFTFPAVMKNQYLIWAHMQRKRSQMTPELCADLDELLKHSMKVTQAMIEVACMREWFGTAQGMIEFRRCLVQALDIKTSQLLQIPHFSEKQVELCHGFQVTTLREFLAMATLLLTAMGSLSEVSFFMFVVGTHFSHFCLLRFSG